MKRTVALALRPRRDQENALFALQRAFTAARNFAAVVAFEHRETNRVRLHHLVYRRLRDRLPTLGSQMACNAIASAARSLKAHRAKGRPWTMLTFRGDASVHFDARTFGLNGEVVSLFTMEGRAELLCRRGRWYLHVAIELPDVAPVNGGVLGIDLGENVAAATSRGGL